MVGLGGNVTIHQELGFRVGAGEFALFPDKHRQRTGVANHLTHGVNIAMALKSYALRYTRDGQLSHLDTCVGA